MKKTKIAYITETSTGDKHAWSGTAHYVYEALQKQGFEVEALGPARPGLIRLAYAIANKLSIWLFRRRFDYRHSTAYSRAFGRLFSNKLSQTSCDMVVVCGGTEYGAYLKTQKPVFYILDRTIEGALNYHSILSGLWNFSKKQSVATDKKAMLESTLVFFSSPWAALHAVKFYNLPKSKALVIPFGANMDKIPDRETALSKKTDGVWKLLFVGTYWMNKGGDIAYNTLLQLLKHTINAQLTVVGCIPPPEIKHDCLNIIGFVDKNSEQGQLKMWELFKEHHFFILPTRFDCTPIVFCEAGAFGVPVLSANTGGVGGHVSEGVNGFLLPYEDKGEAYAKKIIEIVTFPEAYKKLSVSSRTHFENELNWEVWGNRFTNAIRPYTKNE